MDRTSGRAAGRPRRLRICTDKTPAPVVDAGFSSTRNGAGEGLATVAVDRHKQAKTDRPSAATCKRRKARASSPASGQVRTPANPPLASNCSTDQAARRPARTITSRSSATPAAAQAGACGSQGGATSASQPPAADNCARAGNNKAISPRPLRSTRNSVRFPRGQPPPGNSASSAAWPLGMLASGRLASASPRQISPRASTAARSTGAGAAFMSDG